MKGRKADMREILLEPTHGPDTLAHCPRMKQRESIYLSGVLWCARDVS